MGIENSQPNQEMWPRQIIDLRKAEVKGWEEGTNEQDPDEETAERKAREKEQMQETVNDEEVQRVQSDEQFLDAAANVEDLHKFIPQLEHIASTGSIGSYSADGAYSSTIDAEIARAVASVVKERNWDEDAAAMFVANRLRTGAIEGYQKLLEVNDNPAVRKMLTERVHEAQSLTLFVKNKGDKRDQLAA